MAPLSISSSETNDVMCCYCLVACQFIVGVARAAQFASRVIVARSFLSSLGPARLSERFSETHIQLMTKFGEALSGRLWQNLSDRCWVLDGAAAAVYPYWYSYSKLYSSPPRQYLCLYLQYLCLYLWWRWQWWWGNDIQRANIANGSDDATKISRYMDVDMSSWKMRWLMKWFRSASSYFKTNPIAIIQTWYSFALTVSTELYLRGWFPPWQRWNNDSNVGHKVVVSRLLCCCWWRCVDFSSILGPNNQKSSYSTATARAVESSSMIWGHILLLCSSHHIHPSKQVRLRGCPQLSAGCAFCFLGLEYLSTKKR